MCLSAESGYWVSGCLRRASERALVDQLEYLGSIRLARHVLERLELADQLQAAHQHLAIVGVAAHLVGSAIAAFDWDSSCKVLEPELVGFIAHAFCTDWRRAEH